MKHWNNKQIVKITATDKASQRVKNRIREHGPVFKVESHHLTERWWLMREVLGEGQTGEWLGWMPMNEFEVLEVVGVVSD